MSSDRNLPLWVRDRDGIDASAFTKSVEMTDLSHKNLSIA